MSGGPFRHQADPRRNLLRGADADGRDAAARERRTPALGEREIRVISSNAGSHEVDAPPVNQFFTRFRQEDDIAVERAPLRLRRQLTIGSPPGRACRPPNRVPTP